MLERERMSVKHTILETIYLTFVIHIIEVADNAGITEQNNTNLSC